MPGPADKGRRVTLRDMPGKIPATLCLLCVAHAALVAHLAHRNFPNVDELAHLPSGVAHLLHGDYRYYRVNPPLVRSVAAIPATLCDKARRYPWHIGASPHRDGERPEFKLGYARLSEEGIRHGAHFFLPRLVCIPFSIIGLLAVFCLVKEVLDGRAALVAAAIWTTSPNILSNAATINPDLAATSAGAAVSYFIYLWWRNPTHEAAFCLALATGLALLTKHTWIVLFAAIPLVFAAKIVARRLSHGQKMSADACCREPAHRVPRATGGRQCFLAQA